MFITKKHLSRRTFLNGVGVTMALPLLESMLPAATALAQTAAKGRTRLGCIYVPHGATMDKWTPATAGAGFELSEILQPRAEEIFHLVWDEIRRAGYEKSLNSGIVLTGGGSILDGIPEIAEQIFDLPIRRGVPTGVGGLADHVNSPTFATGVGLALYGYRNVVGDAARAPVGAGALVRVAGRLRGLFKEFF